CGNEGRASIRCSHVYAARGKRGKFHTASGECGRSGVIIRAISKSRQGAFAALVHRRAGALCPGAGLLCYTLEATNGGESATGTGVLRTTHEAPDYDGRCCRRLSRISASRVSTALPGHSTAAPQGSAGLDGYGPAGAGRRL